MWKLIEEVERLMKYYPYNCQSEKNSEDVVIPVKLFDIWSSINWWLSEYDPVHKIGFGYVTGFVEDEWWSVSLDELESLEMVIEFVNLEKKGTIPRIELDKFHRPTKFPNLPFNVDNSD
jgi:hypothetical protein